MIRNLKVMGLALVALLAMSVLASSASAQFESEAAETRLTVSSNDMQKFAPAKGGTAVECTTISLGTASVQSGKANTTVTINPTYSNCETFLGSATAVTTNGCQYVFHSAAGSTTGTTDVECPAGKVIEITVGSICKYTIGTQTGLSSVKFSNKGTGTTREVVVEPNVEGITSTRTTNDFFCPAGGTTGTYVGNATTTGETTTGTTHIGVFVD